MSNDNRELTSRDFARAIPRRQRERIAQGKITSGKDIVALRQFVGMTQFQFALALGISVHTLRNWEQGASSPRRPSIGTAQDRGETSTRAAREPGRLGLTPTS